VWHCRRSGGVASEWVVPIFKSCPCSRFVKCPAFLSSPASVVVAELRCCVNQRCSMSSFHLILKLFFIFGIGSLPWRCLYLLGDIFVADGLISLELVPNCQFFVVWGIFWLARITLLLVFFLCGKVLHSSCGAMGYHGFHNIEVYWSIGQLSLYHIHLTSRLWAFILAGDSCF
jgi:hypothetical protein